MTGLLDTTLTDGTVVPGYLTNIGSVIEEITDWLTSSLSIFTSNPVLFVFVAAAVFGLVIGIVRSLVRGA